jgi:hypothetical protein
MHHCGFGDFSCVAHRAIVDHSPARHLEES